MIWNSDDLDFGRWYVQCQKDKTKSFIVYELRKFQRDAMDNCIWIKTPCGLEWTRYNSLYFSNGVIGVYNPSDIQYCNLLRIEFEDSLDILTIEYGLCFSFLNQFDFGIENEEVIAGVKKIAKIKH